jgi:hypothetical protein
MISTLESQLQPVEVSFLLCIHYTSKEPLNYPMPTLVEYHRRKASSISTLRPTTKINVRSKARICFMVQLFSIMKG